MTRFAMASLVAACLCQSAFGQSVTREDVEAGFASAVMGYCLPAIAENRTLESLAANPELPGLEVPPRDRPARMPDATLWEVSGLGGIVAIEADVPDFCMVFAYGPRIQQLYDEMETGVLDHAVGFTLTTNDDEPGNLQFRRQYDAVVEGSQIRVVLSGNEPGAPGTRSRFSTATAFVTTIEPDDAE